MINWQKTLIRYRDQGVAAVEFALILPVILLTFIGLYEVGEFVYCNNKMNRTAQSLSNIITRGDITSGDLNNVMAAASLIAQPFDFVKGDGNVIVTSVSNPTGNQAEIMWQQAYPGGTGASKISPGSLPGGLALGMGETVIFTEVFYTFQPLVPGYVLSAQDLDIYALAAAVPRKGQMTTLP